MPKPFERYQTYIRDLEREGKSLPTNQFGDLNFTQIATDCGMRRQWFSENSNKVFGTEGQTLSQIIQDDMSALGVKKNESINTTEKLAKSAELKSKEASQLRKILNIKLSEIESLKEEIKELRVENSLLKAKNQESEERNTLLTDTGRSFQWIE